MGLPFKGWNREAAAAAAATTKITHLLLRDFESIVLHLKLVLRTLYPHNMMCVRALVSVFVIVLVYVSKQPYLSAPPSPPLS